MSGKPVLLKNAFVNRVVGSGEESPEQLLANPANFRIHPDFQQQSLAGSIDSIGYIDPVLVNKRTDTIIDGHLRVQLALRSGVKMIPVTYVDLSEDEEKLALLSLDPIAAMAASDRAKLDELLHQVNSDDERVQQMLASIGGIPVDFAAEWHGMPEFEQEDLTALKTIHVHFAKLEDIDTFSELIGQKITENTRAIWYPKAKQQDFADEVYHAES